MKTQSTTPVSYLRVFNALLGSASYTLYVDEKKWAKDYLYEDFTSYQPLVPGEHLIKLCTYPKNETLYEHCFMISEAKIYTFVLSYPPNSTDIEGILIQEPPKPIPEDHLLMRCANFSQQTLPLMLHLIDTLPVFKKIPIRNAGSYLSFLPTCVTIELLETESQKVLASQKACLFKPYRYYTLYLIGGTKPYPLKWVQTIDGNSFIHF